MNVNYIVDKLNHKHMKTIIGLVSSVHYSALIAILFLCVVVSCAMHTQCYSQQHIHRIEFEQCIGDDISDDMCDSCYHAVLDHHHYWFNNDLYNEDE